MNFRNCADHAEFFEETRREGTLVYGRGRKWFVAADATDSGWELADGPFESETLARVEEIAKYIEEECHLTDGVDMCRDGNVCPEDLARAIRELFGVAR